MKPAGHNSYYALQAYIMDLLNSCGFSYCPWLAGKNRFSGTNIFYLSLGTNIFYWSLGTNRFLVFPLNLFFPATRVEYKNPNLGFSKIKNSIDLNHLKLIQQSHL